MRLRALPCLALLSIPVILAACATAPTPVKSAKTWYEEGEAAFAKQNYEEAANDWKKVRETYSSPELSAQADLKIADAHFENKSYIEAAAAYEDFRKLHPTNPRVQYALYRLALSHYYQITGIDTDQTPVKNAVTTLQSFLNLYPDSTYTPDVREKLADCKAKQLEYENYVGNFYLRTGKYSSAIKRLNEALVKFPNNPKLDETLFLLGKAYIKSGDNAQGQAVLKRLATQFPDSPKAKEAAGLIGNS
jgi:outer membrane protein assembly factor BamD